MLGPYGLLHGTMKRSRFFWVKGDNRLNIRKDRYLPAKRNPYLLLSFYDTDTYYIYTYDLLAWCSGSPAPLFILSWRMTITFENNNDIICYALKKIISYARDNQYIFLAQSIWWVSSVIGLQQGRVVYIDNLRKHREASALSYEGPVNAAVSQQGSSQSIHETPIPHDKARAGLEDDRSGQELQLRDTSIDFGNSNIDKLGSCQAEIIVQDTNQFIRLPKKERKAYRKQKESLSKIGLGRTTAPKTSKTTATKRSRPSMRTWRIPREATIISRSTAIDDKTKWIDHTELWRSNAADECLRCA